MLLSILALLFGLAVGNAASLFYSVKTLTRRINTVENNQKFLIDTIGEDPATTVDVKKPNLLLG